MSTFKKDELILFFQETNNHLRTSDDKRDKVLSIYIAFTATILGFLVGNSDKLISEKDSNIILLTIFCLGALIILGEVVTWSMISYRKWHAEYMNCAIIMQDMLINESHIVDLNFIQAKKAEPYQGSFHTSKGFILSQLTLFINVLFTGYFLRNTFLGSYIYIVNSVIAFIVIGVNLTISRKVLIQSQVKFWEDPFKSWIISGFYKKKEKDEADTTRN